MNLDDVRFPGELDPDVVEYWHQPLAKRLELLAGIDGALSEAPGRGKIGDIAGWVRAASAY